MVWIAAEFGQARVHISAKGLTELASLCDGEYKLCSFGGQLTSFLGRAGLHQNRAPLHRSADVKGTAHGKELAFMVHDMQFLGIEEFATLDVADEGVVLPAVP